MPNYNLLMGTGTKKAEYTESMYGVKAMCLKNMCLQSKIVWG